MQINLAYAYAMRYILDMNATTTTNGSKNMNRKDVNLYQD